MISRFTCCVVLSTVDFFFFYIFFTSLFSTSLTYHPRITLFPLLALNVPFFLSFILMRFFFLFFILLTLDFFFLDGSSLSQREFSAHHTFNSLWPSPMTMMMGNTAGRAYIAHFETLFLVAEQYLRIALDLLFGTQKIKYFQN